MRKTTYFCDRCGKEVEMEACVRIGVQTTTGKEVKKGTHDFCAPCFYIVKEAFEKACKPAPVSKQDASSSAPMTAPSQEKEEGKESKSFLDWMLERDRKKSEEEMEKRMQKKEELSAQSDAEKKESPEKSKGSMEEVRALKEEPSVKEESIVPKEASKAEKERIAVPEKPVADWINDPWEVTTTGPIKGAEKERIFRLYLVYGWTEEEIAKELGRLPKGVKKNLTMAIQKGELESWRKAFEPDIAALDAQKKEESAATFAGNELVGDDMPFLGKPSEGEEKESGKGGEDLVDYLDAILDRQAEASSKAIEEAEAGSCTSRSEKIPSHVTMGGKRYDVGGIIALARAGWGAEDIAKDKGYEVLMVNYFIGEYKDEIEKPRRQW